MKQFITLLCIAVFTVSYANSTPNEETNGFVTITGDFTNVCQTESYVVASTDFDDTLDILSVSGQYVSSYFTSYLSPSEKLVTITFSQGSTTRFTTVYFSYLLNFDFLSTSRSVSISPNNVSVPTVTNGTTGSFSQQFYTFTASAPGASSYIWEVDGGTISGSTTGSTIKVVADASACAPYFSHPNRLKARARAVSNCGGASAFSTWDPRYISAPVYVGTISGPDTVGLYYGDYAGYTSSAYVPSGAIHEYVWSVTGPFQLGGNGTSQVFVFVNTYSQSGSGTLFVYVRNVCGQTITKSKNILIGNPFGGRPGGDDFGWVDVTETKIVSTQHDFKLIVPNFEDKSLMITIYDLNGRVIDKIRPDNLEVQLDRSKYRDGIYVVKTVGEKERSTTKFVVKQ